MTGRGRRQSIRLSEQIAVSFLCVATGIVQAQSSSSAAAAAIEREYQAAMSAQDRGDLNQAESMLLALRAKHPGIFAVDESLGLLYIAREQFTAALPILKAAVEEDPSSPVAHANLGADYLKLGKNQEEIGRAHV